MSKIKCVHLSDKSRIVHGLLHYSRRWKLPFFVCAVYVFPYLRIWLKNVVLIAYKSVFFHSAQHATGDFPPEKLHR